MVTKEMVIDRLNETKEQAAKMLNELRMKGDLLDYDTIAALEETIDLTARLIVTMPWDKLSHNELRNWYEAIYITSSSGSRN